MRIAIRDAINSDNGYIVARLARALDRPSSPWGNISRRAVANALLFGSTVRGVAYDLESGALFGFVLARGADVICSYVSDEVRKNGIGARLKNFVAETPAAMEKAT